VRRGQAGNSFLISLILTLAFSTVISSFLYTLNQEYQITHRSYYYGNALYVAEAGVEEAICALNYAPNGWGSGGWGTFNGNTNFAKTVTNFTSVTGGSALGSYSVRIFGATNLNPVIICTGVVDAASATMQGSPYTNMVRAVRAVLAKRPLFQWALLAQNRIDMNGNNIRVDSFDSSDPNYSNYDIVKGYGTYDPAEPKDNGDLASNSGVTNSISVGNADIFGRVHTGEGGSVSVGNQGFVAALGQQTNGVIDTSRVSHSVSVDLPPPVIPSNWSPAMNLGNMTGSWIINGGGATPFDLNASSISIASTSYIKFNSGYTRLYVSGSVSVTGSATIIVEPGARVEIYVRGTSLMAGGGIVNNDGRATSFQLYGLTSNSVTVAGNGQLTALVYAPLADVSLSGGGASGHFTGAAVGNNIAVGGQTQFHYDEALVQNGPTRGYSVMSWQEL
jgi:hypothetical protein